VKRIVDINKTTHWDAALQTGNGKCLRRGKICPYESYYVPMLTYRAGTCTWTKADITRLTAAEMGFLKSIEGRTKRERIRSEKKIEFKFE
jgi:hypothetical protein